MNLCRKPIYTLVLLYVLMPFKGFGQQQDVKARSGAELKNAAKEIILSSSSCTLITLDQEGRPRARIMDAFLPDQDFNIWFGTNPKSRKVKQITTDNRVTLFYKDHDDSGYVMICGSAEIVNDPEEKEKHWKEEWAPFYENRQDGFVLIKVSPDWMEVVSNTRGILGDPVTWEAERVDFDPVK